jgi:hypothetical protein
LFHDGGEAFPYLFLTLELHLTLVANDHGVPALWDDVFVLGACFDSHVNIVGWCSSHNWTFNSKNFTSDDFGRNFIIFVFWNFVSGKLLVLRVAVFMSPVKI